MDKTITIDGEYQIVRQKILWHEWNTFEGWSEMKRKIRKGSKAHWINGKPYFHKSQVHRRGSGFPERSRNKKYDHGMQYGDVDEMSDWTGEPCGMDFYS